MFNQPPELFVVFPIGPILFLRVHLIRLPPGQKVNKLCSFNHLSISNMTSGYLD